MGQDNQKVANYTIIEAIGHGSFGDVYRVKNTRGKEFAMKKIRRGHTLYGPSSNTATDISFLSEVDHKFILKYVESFRDTESDCWCLVTELCKEDLEKQIDRTRKSNQVFGEDTILGWFGMIAAALDHLHDKKIMHRDLKPANVLLCNDGSLRLSDFGIAKFLTADPAKGTACGCWAYMAPEVKNNQPYDMKCDVWSLGVLLFELCTLHCNFHETGKEINSRYSKDLRDSIKQMLKENPAERPNIKTVCDLHKNIKSSVAKKEVQPNSPTKPTSQKEEKNNPSDSGYSSTSLPSTSATDKQGPSSPGATRKNQVKGPSSETSTQMHESFLSGLDEDRISIIRSDIKVRNIVHSPTSGIIYGSWEETVSGYKWDVKKKTFTHLFTCTRTGDCIESLVLAPLHTNGTDQLYISVGSGMKTTKQAYRLGGREMEDKVLLTDTSYIDDKCNWWRLGSDPHKQILLIHPFCTSVIYIHVKEQRHAEVDLNEVVELDLRWRWIVKIELIGRNLLLGEGNENKLYISDLVVTQEGASIKSDTEWGPVETYCGIFAAVCNPMTDGEQQNDQLHLITAECNRDDDYTVLREYRVGLFGVGDVTHGSSSQLDCSSQPTQSLTVREKVLFPDCVIHEHTSCPVLIGKKYNYELFAIELDKKL